MTKFNADTESHIAKAIEYTKTTPSVKLSKVAVKFVVRYDLFCPRIHGRAAGNTHGGQTVEEGS
jgi:hypothetical protein